MASKRVVTPVNIFTLICVNRNRKLVSYEVQLDAPFWYVTFDDDVFILGFYNKTEMTKNFNFTQQLTIKEKFFLDRGYFMPEWLTESDFREAGTEIVMNSF